MRQIIVKSPTSTGVYKKVFEVDDSDYDRFSDVAMEAMTRATEEVVNNFSSEYFVSLTTQCDLCCLAFIQLSNIGARHWEFHKNGIHLLQRSNWC